MSGIKRLVDQSTHNNLIDGQRVEPRKGNEVLRPQGLTLSGAASAHPQPVEDGQTPRRAAAKSGTEAPASEPLQANRGEHEREYISLVLTDGGVKQVPIRHASSENKVFIDWITITANVDGFLRYNGYKAFTDDDIARAWSALLQEIFGEGFGISKKNPFGLHFHRDSYVIGDNFGVFCIGHQKHNRFMVSISGDGWLNARPEAGKRLHDLLVRLDEQDADVRISRVDLAVDYFTGGPKHDEFEAAYHRGEFVRQRRHLNSKDAWPHYQVYGCVHTERGRKAGITDAIGVRTSDLYLRRYDKGRELGAPDSEWVRVELEMKSKDTLIPLDVLIAPDAYFCQYPWLRELRNSFATRLEAKRERAQITVDAAEKIIKTQFGKYLRILRQLTDSDADLLDRLQHDDPEAWPPRLAKIAPQIFVPLHKQPLPEPTGVFADLSGSLDDFAASAYGYPDESGSARSHIH
jgi:phage replication initiation protein